MVLRWAGLSPQVTESQPLDSSCTVSHRSVVYSNRMYARIQIQILLQHTYRNMLHCSSSLCDISCTLYKYKE